MKKIILLVSFLTLVFSSVQAEAMDNSGFYLGGGVGEPSGEITDNDSRSFDMELEKQSLHVIAGYQMGRIFSLEMQYINYGKDRYSIVEPTSLSISGNVGYTFDTGLRPFFVLGLGVTDVNLKYDVASDILVEDSDLSYHYGVGLDFTPEKLGGLTFRVAYEADFVNIEISRFNGYSFSQLEMFDVDLSSVYGAVIYKF